MELDMLPGALAKYTQAVINSVPAAMMEVTAKMVSDVKGRIIHLGINANNMHFHPYSRRTSFVTPKSFKTTAAWRKFISEGKADAGTKGKRGQPWYGAAEWRTIKGKKVMILTGGYKRFRELHGLQTNFKDLYWTGTMLNSVRVFEPTIAGFKVVLKFGPGNSHEETKLSGNQNREGIKILLPNDVEIKVAVMLFEKIIKRVNFMT